MLMTSIKRTYPLVKLCRFCSTSTNQVPSVNVPLYLGIVSDPGNRYSDIIIRDMTIHENFLSEKEETALYDDVTLDLKKRRYEFNHWDNAIIGFRELQKSNWTPEADAILKKVKQLAFPPGKPLIGEVHVLDLEEKGYITPHVDSVRFCGNTIAGLSLLSDSIMRLSLEEDRSIQFDVLLERRSLYIMKNEVRYKFAHEILKKEESTFKGKMINRGRRISIICRNMV